MPSHQAVLVAPQALGYPHFSAPAQLLPATGSLGGQLGQGSAVTDQREVVQRATTFPPHALA
jgi:hypothetical protein